MLTVTPQALGYLPVATATLCPATVLDCDLFIQRANSTYLELYRGNGFPLEQVDLDRLLKAGTDHLYIRCVEAEAYRKYLCEHVLSEASIAPAARVSALREVTRVVFQEALLAGSSELLVDVATDFGTGLATLVSDKPIVFRELFDILEHDFYTFTHVCNVSMYCVLMARDLGVNDQTQLAEIATGALLHDIGKRHIPSQVLNKPGKLDDDEWELIRSHPTTGYRELAGRDDVTWAQLMMVYQHHERLDGSGYPAGIQGSDMHLWARICAVADVFDALTCHRPYRKAVPVPEVCSYLARYAGTWFDADAVGCWSSQIAECGV